MEDTHTHDSAENLTAVETLFAQPRLLKEACSDLPATNYPSLPMQQASSTSRLSDRESLPTAEQAVQRAFEDGASKRSTRNWASLVLGLMALCCFGWMFSGAAGVDELAEQNQFHAQAATASRPLVDKQYAVDTIAIRDVRVGMRVPAYNPERSDHDRQHHPVTIDQTTWRKIVVDLPKPDSGGSVLVTLLRPEGWLGERLQLDGKHVWLELPELGAAGYGRLISDEPSPAIQSGPGQVVTATFVHSSAQVLDLVLQPVGASTANAELIRSSSYQTPGSDELSIGVTSLHPFWSETRSAFIPAGKFFAL